jgi:hypothetical protein
MLKELNTLQLYQILKNDSCTKEIFLGVFSRDKLPTKIKLFPCCFVLNTQSSYQTGEHWLAMFYDKSGFCHFFDSFGRPPEYFGLEKYIKDTSVDYSSNKTIYQDSKTNTCGYFCFIYLILMCKNKQIYEFYFSDKTLHNELILALIFNKVF